MASMSFKDIGIGQSHKSSGIAHFALNLAGVLKAVATIKNGDVLFLQYPLKKYFSFICNMAHARGAKVVALIHDLSSCRRKTLTPEVEIRRLSNADYIIATNDAMAAHLRSLGLKRPIGSLGCWDYLSDSIPKSSEHDGVKIAYAGSINRRKNTFLYEWGDVIDGYTVELYGGYFDDGGASCAEKFNCHGFVDADKLISSVEADYGLVWDGASLDECSGSFGEYLALNTSHKVSLYLRSGLPIIVWDKSAMAPFVKKHGIGLTISSLRELDKAVRAVSAEDYSAMKKKAIEVGERSASGYFFRQAASDALKGLGKIG